MAQKRISATLAKAIKTALTFISDNLVTKIELEYAQVAIQNVIEKLKATTDVLADNIDNKEQLQLIWGTFFADPQIAGVVRDALLDAISKIKDPAVSDGLSLLVEPLTQTLVALTDADTNNGDQLEKIWLEFARSKPFIDFVQKYLKVILSKIIKNETVVTLIVALLDLLEE